MAVTRRRVLRSALVPAMLGLAGCGFRPMYGRRGGEPVAAELAAVRIERIPSRLGHILRNNLIEHLTPFGEPAQPRYSLAVQVRESRSALAIQSDSTITRFNLRVSASFTLTDIATGLALMQGRARAVGSFDAVGSDFATLTAEQDSARRTVREVSEDMRAQFGAFFDRRLAAAN